MKRMAIFQGFICNCFVTSLLRRSLSLLSLGVYVVQQEGTGRERTLHRNLLLPYHVPHDSRKTGSTAKAGDTIFAQLTTLGRKLTRQ